MPADKNKQMIVSITQRLDETLGQRKSAQVVLSFLFLRYLEWGHSFEESEKSRDYLTFIQQTKTNINMFYGLGQMGFYDRLEELTSRELLIETVEQFEEVEVHSQKHWLAIFRELFCYFLARDKKVFYYNRPLSLVELYPMALYVLGKENEGWLEELLKLADPDEIYHLGFNLVNGYMCRQDVIVGERVLRKAVELKHPQAMFELGRKLLSDPWNREKLKEAEVLLREAANRGIIGAMYMLGMELWQGEKLPYEPEEGPNYLLRAAKMGHRRSMGKLGFNSSQFNEAEQIDWFRKAAEKGDPYSKQLLAKKLLAEKLSSSDQIEGEKWLRQSVNHYNVEDMFNLGVYLLNEKKEAVEGEKWLRKAADWGYDAALCELGIRLCNGNLLPLNINEGIMLLRRAAERGDIGSVYELGKKLLQLKIDIVEGEKWLRKAADRGIIRAMYMLGMELSTGKTLTKNEWEGKQWLQEADNRSKHIYNRRKGKLH